MSYENLQGMIKINSMKCGSTTHTAGMISFFVMSITDLQKKNNLGSAFYGGCKHDTARVC